MNRAMIALERWQAFLDVLGYTLRDVAHDLEHDPPDFIRELREQAQMELW